MKTKIIIQILLMMLGAVALISQSENYDFECDCPQTTDSYNNNISLNHVTFHGNEFDELIPIQEDGFGLYPEIQFFSQNNYYPVAYVSGSRAWVSAAFTSSCNHPLWIRGTYDDGNDKFCFKPQLVSPQGYRDYYYPMTASDRTFGDGAGNDQVNAFPEFEIYWEASTDGIHFSHIGTSTNPLYVTFHSPNPNTVIHHSTIANSCTAAAGETEPSEIVDAIYTLYESRCIRTVSDKGHFIGHCFSYWGNEQLSLDCSSTADLYLHRYGRSENFSELFKDMINVQGLDNPVFDQPRIIEISYDVSLLLEDLETDLQTVFTLPGLKTPGTILEDAAGVITVEPSLFTDASQNYAVYITYDTDFQSDPLDGISTEPTSMLYIKNFPQATDNTIFLTDGDGSTTFTSKPNDDALTMLFDNIGLAAQGNGNPPSRFSNPFLVDYLGKIYDPSYGVSSSGHISEWEAKVIEGYGIRLFSVPLRNNNLAPPSVESRDLDYIHKIEVSGQQTIIN